MGRAALAVLGLFAWTATASGQAEDGCEEQRGKSLLQTEYLGRGVAVPSDRDCKALVLDDCSFEAESDMHFDCKIEHATRLMHTAWVRPDSSVLEVGARYGQTSCLLSKVLDPSRGAKLFSVDADPKIWSILESNLAKHNCKSTIVKGVIGSKHLKLLEHAYGSKTVPEDDPRPGIQVPAHSVQSLNATIDTLAIDCEGCFGSFLEENPSLLDSLSMIIVEVHDMKNNRETETVEKLMKEGWDLKMKICRQRVLCKGPCQLQCDRDWLRGHADKTWQTHGDI
eukprot:TRINITY_DN102837_c0_g1_i1.p1 TRINITY_DN102837_c0_g1~~TRINITY_DN102837_c0_g1_i1.p1  ORF type:complete len:282 (-),score=51.31 TRINITY_DN102837_c0_g1_i1:254-1099(-)